MRHALALRAAVLVPLGALLCWLLIDAGFLNYDTAYSLLWGGDLLHGRLPDWHVTLAPTAHPLAELLGAILTPFGGAAQPIWVVIAFLALGALGWLAYELAAHWFGPAAGAVAGLVIVTRIPVLSYGVRAYVDIPYCALALGAILIEARRPRAGAWPLVLLALAGLLRPEAWLLSIGYLAWLYLGGERDARRLARLVAIAAAAPLLWALRDLIVTGDPLHSLIGTREGAQVLERTTGLGAVPTTVPRRLGEILREPGLFGAAAGGLLVLCLMWRRARLPIAAGFASIAAFCVLAVAGLPILGRYLLLPATLLAVFCGAGVFGWLALPREHSWRRRWAAIGALVAVSFVVFAPGQVQRIRSLRHSMQIQGQILSDLHAITRAPAFTQGCRPVAVPNHRPVPHIALWAGIDPGDVVSAQQTKPTHGLYVDPASARVEKNFTLDPNDPHPLTAAVPAGYRRVAANRSWILFERC